ILEQWYVVEVFICGLPWELGNDVRLFKPKSLKDAYCLALLQEAILEAVQKRNGARMTPNTERLKLNESNEKEKDSNGLMVLDKSCEENWLLPNPNMMMTNSSGTPTDSCREFEIKMSGLNGNYGMKNNASTMGVSKIGVVDVYDSMFNFSERDGSTNFNKLVEMYNGKYDDNKEEDDDFVVCDLVQSKGVDVLGKDYGTGFIKGLEDVNRTVGTRKE
ncbi:hypothetical protein Tco_1308012, partial [Tanacetum coccineum]